MYMSVLQSLAFVSMQTALTEMLNSSSSENTAEIDNNLSRVEDAVLILIGTDYVLAEAPVISKMRQRRRPISQRKVG